MLFRSPTTEWGGQEPDGYKLIAYIGDPEPVQLAKENLVSILRDRGKLRGGSLDMEPFEVLRDIIRSEKFPSVGGPVQLVKIYEHANAIPVGVYWPDKASGTVAVLGRPLLDYEKSQWGVLDPDCPDRARPIEEVVTSPTVPSSGDSGVLSPVVSQNISP